MISLKFYELFKVHKDHSQPDLPPERPIVSGCGSITENIIFLKLGMAKCVEKPNRLTTTVRTR